VEFKSAYGLAESVARLQAATSRFSLRKMADQVAMGTVSERRVLLQRVIPTLENSFKPFFRGRFEQRGAEVHLIGRFAMFWPVKVFMTLWLIVTLSMAFPVAWRHVGVPLEVAPPRGVPLLMFGFGVLLVIAGKWFGRHDEAWLSDVIRKALDAPPPRLKE
jgi:hypothetical protein